MFAKRRAICRKCRTLQQRQWRDNNYEHVREQELKWQKENAKHLAIIKRQYQIDNKEKLKLYDQNYLKQNYKQIIERIRIYRNEREKIDLDFKLANYLRSRLNKALHNNQKAGSAVDDLDCTIEELKKYLESKFEPGMTWDNWSVHGWHIDHIKPLSKFDLTDPEQFKIACRYTNLQPLWAKDNLVKSNDAPNV